MQVDHIKVYSVTKSESPNTSGTDVCKIYCEEATVKAQNII